MIQWPYKLGGKPKIVSWLNRLLDGVRASEVKGVIGGRLIENSDGKVIVIGDSQAASSGPQMFLLMEEANDWNICVPITLLQGGTPTVASVDDETCILGTGDVFIAKPPELRHTIATEIIDGATFDYTYPDEHTRVATAEDDSTETEVVTPWYLPYNPADISGASFTIIYAQAVAGGTGVWREVDTDVWQQLTLLEQSPRAWARQDASPP